MYNIHSNFIYIPFRFIIMTDTNQDKDIQPFDEEAFLLQMQEEEYMKTLTTPATSLSISEPLTEDEFTIQQNERIIKAADELLLDRMENRDGSLRLGEVIQAKDSAFKNNQLLKNKATENININVNELQSKTPAELLEMLESLN